MVVTNWSKTERKKLASFQQNVTNYQNVTQIDYFYFTWIQIVASCWFRECSSSSMVWWGFASLFAKLRSSAGTQQPWCLPDPALSLWTWDDYNIGDREEQWARRLLFVTQQCQQWSPGHYPAQPRPPPQWAELRCKISTANVYLVVAQPRQLTIWRPTTGNFSLLRTVSIFLIPWKNYLSWPSFNLRPHLPSPGSWCCSPLIGAGH